MSEPTTEPTKPADQSQNLAKGNADSTKLVSPPKKSVSVKLEILRDCEVNHLDGRMSVEIKGSVVEVTEDEAKRLLSFRAPGCYGFTGEREGDEKKQTLKKARIYKDRVEVESKKSELERLDEQVAS